MFRKKTGVSANDEPAPARRPTRKPSDPNDAVFSSTHAHPMVANLISELAQSGILAELDSTAREVAAGRVSPFDDGDRPDGPDPSAPVKIRARSILRRNSSITVPDPNAPAAPEAPLAPGAPRVRGSSTFSGDFRRLRDERIEVACRFHGGNALFGQFGGGEVACSQTVTGLGEGQVIELAHQSNTFGTA